ncbi:g5781 [Coccomyxa elongata]
MKNFDVAEAWLKEQLGGHDSEWQKQLEVAEKWVERSKPKQQTKEKSAKFADREPSKRPERPAYVRGRLRQAAAFWTRICHSSVVLAWIMQGYMIQWAAFPPQPFVADNLSGAMTHADWVSQQIWDLQCKGSVVPVSMVPTVVSPLNVVLRRGKPRLVLDLTYVDSFIDTSGLKFKYEQLKWASVVVQPNDFLFSVDLEAAYHHVEMHPSSWKYLGFCWEGQYYVFTVLPFGLNTACWVFTKLTRELVSHWRGQGIRSVHYLDDFLFAIPKDVDGGDTQFRAVQAKIFADIKAAGFSLSEPKLKLDPSQGWGGYTVSSSSGFKAQVAVGMDEFLTDHRSQIAQGYLSPSEQLESSTWRELIAIERVLLSLGHLLAGSAGIDALAYDWSGQNNWVNPPFALNGRWQQNGRTTTRKKYSPAYQLIATLSLAGTSTASRASRTCWIRQARPDRGHWTGLRHVETDHCLYDVWRDLNADRRAFTHIATSGQSAAGLDQWLISEQLRARVSKEPQATGHVIGYPGDHLGVSLSLTAPDTTLYGAARSWALAAQQRASLKLLEADGRAAMAAYSRAHSAETLLAWQDAHQLLQAVNAEAVKGAALHAGVVWQFYGEQSTFWFHHLARERQSRTEVKAFRAGPHHPPVEWQRVTTTLLNPDYKLAARTLASRLGPVLNHAGDATQTGFLPKRWVGDNVLAHLEEISYLQETQEPGVMVFLDFEKAFDRPPSQGDRQAARARAAVLESLLRLLDLQEPSLAFSTGTGSAGRSSPAHLAARQTPAELFSTFEASQLQAPLRVRKFMESAAAPPPHTARQSQLSRDTERTPVLQQAAQGRGQFYLRLEN